MPDEMIKLRKELDKLGVPWEDRSEVGDGMLGIYRTHFYIDKNRWSVICGSGTYGHEAGALELMTSAINGGDPVGWLSAENVIEKVKEVLK